MSGVLESQPDPEVTAGFEVAGRPDPDRRVSSPPAPDSTVSSSMEAAILQSPSMTPDYARARRHLMRADPRLGSLVKRIGACGLAHGHDTDRFGLLVRSIISQQLSAKAAMTIHGRVLAALEAEQATPQAMLAIDQDRLRACGLSRAKVASVRDLATKVTEGSLALDTLDALDDAEVIEAMTTVRGIGRWSAEMFLIFRLKRPDILPVGDVGVQRAMRALYGLRKHPSPQRMTELARPWRPYRSVACWYLWRSLD